MRRAAKSSGRPSFFHPWDSIWLRSFLAPHFLLAICGMETGELLAWHYASRQPVIIRWSSGRIREIVSAPAGVPNSLWIAPSLFDVQVNGFAGVDFQRDDLKVEDLLRATRGLRASGCARFLLTLITDEWPKLTARLRHLAALREQSEELKAAIVGWHIEGPFLSELPGYHGAHDLKLMLDPQPEHIRQLRALAGDVPLMITLAPERAGALAAIELAAALGIVVSLGHTNAPAELLAQAQAAGATLFTHLANGCPRELDRHDNILWRVCETPGLTPSFIPDRIHVSPAPFRVLHRALNNRVIYTTDAMAAAGAGPGTYPFGKMQLEVGLDQIVRLPGKTNFAGSALRPVEGVFRTAEMLGCPWQEAWGRFSEKPAQLMGLSHELVVGAPATFCVVEISPAGGLRDLQTYWNG